jgi:hypothetical protein
MPSEVIKSTWSKMWETEESEVNKEHFKEYLLEYSPGNLELLSFPTIEEFEGIIKWLSCWKSEGPDRIYNFFRKKIRSLHGHLYGIIKEIFLNGETLND